jgi:hypothetical protein
MNIILSFSNSPTTQRQNDTTTVVTEMTSATRATVATRATNENIVAEVSLEINHRNSINSFKILYFKVITLIAFILLCEQKNETRRVAGCTFASTNNGFVSLIMSRVGSARSTANSGAELLEQLAETANFMRGLASYAMRSI